MNESWSTMRQVPQEMLQERLQTVKQLSKDKADLELYEVVKDTATGEHYLHYAYAHLTIGEGARESYHQLMPLDSDDLLAVMFGKRGYRYPEHWRRSYLRNGPDGVYVWFDPTEAWEGATESKERLAGEIVGMLGDWKRKGEHDPESVRRLLERLEQTFRENERGDS